MHSFQYDIADDETVVIHHNGDYSGDAIVTRNFENRSMEITVPCAALLEFAANFVRNNRISKLEQASAEELLEGEIDAN